MRVLVIPLLVQGPGQDVTFTATLSRKLPNTRSRRDSLFIPPATPNVPTARRPYASFPKSSSAAACLRGGSGCCWHMESES
ncbi:hypothetical protein GY45DRAFT_871706 [Cubamyces sp. BRFM 1775]|nr:hypothetical protein GY45DRAFT_871706 [Cubamyces sp. BRFM 1775]